MSFVKGDTVARRSVASEVGVVVDGPRTLRGQTWYTIFFGGRRENVLEDDLRQIVEGGTVRDTFIQGALGDHRSFSRLLTTVRINEPVRDTLYSYQASRTELHAYQYKPLLRYLRSPFRRILIADEVGLGKTIEAGYIFQEERARHDLQRVLIVCPASLRIKWQNELYHRFGERFDVLDATAVRRRLLSHTERGIVDPRLFGIVSYETIRSRRLRELLDEQQPRIDLVIADEIHHCRNRDTHNFRVMRTIAENSDSVVFLSATPVHTGNDNLFNLMNLLLPERFDVDAAFQRQLNANRHVVRAESLLCQGTADALEKAREELHLLKSQDEGKRVAEDPFYPVIMDNLRSGDLITNRSLLIETQEMVAGLNLLGDVLTRTSKRDVPEGSAVRRAYAHTPPLTEYEQSVYDMLSTFIFEHYQAKYDSAIARFVLSGLQRQIASSLYAAVLHYRGCFANSDQPSSRIQPFDIEETDFDPDIEEGDDNLQYRLKDDREFRDIVQSICIEQLYRHDTKFKALAEILSHSEKVIVFAFYKRSLHYLQERLAKEGIHSVLIDGDVSSCPEAPEDDERLKRIQMFRNDSRFRIMLSSQVGSEGLDFQFCNTLVNWDLPWNPMVVEQRIGRIDRLGQKSEMIFIHNLVSRGTIEELILERLYHRIGIFKESIGDLEPILGDIIRQLSRELFDPKLSLKEKEQRVIRSAHALEKERAHLLNLEKDSVQLIGHDEVIRQKIEKIQYLGRFLTGKELEIFVGEFLRRHIPASQLHDKAGKEVQAGSEGPRWLHVSPELREFTAKRVDRFSREGQRLIQLLRGDQMKIVFEAAAAVAHPDAEFIHSHHPLIRLIADLYESQSAEIHRVSALQISSETVEPGTYFYGWASVDERGAFHTRHLVTGLIRVPGREGVTETERCERVLHEMVVSGHAWNDGRPDYNADMLNGLYEWLEDHIVTYVERYRLKRNREAKAVVSRQLQAMEASYRVKCERRERAIETARASNRSDTAIRLQEDQIKKLRADFEIRSAKLESRRTVDVSYRIEGVGWLRVNALKHT